MNPRKTRKNRNKKKKELGVIHEEKEKSSFEREKSSFSSTGTILTHTRKSSDPLIKSSGQLDVEDKVELTEESQAEVMTIVEKLSPRARGSAAKTLNHFQHASHKTDEQGKTLEEVSVNEEDIPFDKIHVLIIEDERISRTTIERGLHKVLREKFLNNATDEQIADYFNRINLEDLSERDVKAVRNYLDSLNNENITKIQRDVLRNNVLNFILLRDFAELEIAVNSQEATEKITSAIHNDNPFHIIFTDFDLANSTLDGAEIALITRLLEAQKNTALKTAGQPNITPATIFTLSGRSDEEKAVTFGDIDLSTEKGMLKVNGIGPDRSLILSSKPIQAIIKTSGVNLEGLNISEVGLVTLVKAHLNKTFNAKEVTGAMSFVRRRSLGDSPIFKRHSEEKKKNAGKEEKRTKHRSAPTSIVSTQFSQSSSSQPSVSRDKAAASNIDDDPLPLRPKHSKPG